MACMVLIMLQAINWTSDVRDVGTWEMGKSFYKYTILFKPILTNWYLILSNFCEIGLQWVSPNTIVTIANVDPDPCYHNASLGHNELTHK